MFRDRTILIMALGQTLVWAGLFYVFPALILHWTADPGWSKSQLSVAIAIAVFLSGLASMVAGPVIDRGFGPALMAGCAGLGGLALATLSQAHEIWQFQAIWAFIGLCLAGCLYEPCFVLVTRARGAEAKGGIVAITLVAGFAGTLSFPVANALAGGLGWRTAVQVIGLFVALIVAPLLWWAAARLERERRAHPHHAAEAPETQPRFLRRPAFWALGLAMALMATVHSATLQHLLPILDEHSIAPATAVFVASLIGPMQVAGRLAMIWAGRFLSHHGLTLTCFAMIGTAEIVLVASGRAPILLWLFVPLFGGAVGVVSILRPLLAREILGARNFGAKSGALAFLFLAGGASAPWLGALIWGWGGYDAMLALLTCAAALGAGLYAIARRFGADARGHTS
ncbi:MFS transporter [Aquicoccus porphyridii]|uniref:MFS transporter n=1 Tax=Aquicoccus porphyridii TaxID=1852029 RepID=A0A5A9ZKN0_9RHOB|nr:MFS transporter [Aquicoccus porphyridii]KAA0917609.1 MFS transporter [Aquicoccus porphyridii]RAI55684.1 MFS transporter [Rhodobacteraceae bacterium AsT-22]